MNVFLLIYGAVLLIILFAGISVYRYFARRNKWLAFALCLLLMAFLTLFWPIPIHGGVTFVFAELYGELQSLRMHRAITAEEQKRDAFKQRQNDRFLGTVELSIVAPLSDTWRQVLVAGQVQGWHETASNLVWSDWLPLPGAAPLPSLDSAKRLCRAYPPGGYWALANEAENSLLWKSGGRRLLPKSAYSTVSYMADESLRMELPTYGLRPAPHSAQGQNGSRAGFAVRCVALAEGAPPEGYGRKDIPLEDWNRYQMQKLLPDGDS